MTIKLLSYRFRFFDEEPLLDENNNPTEFPLVSGGVEYIFEIQRDGSEPYRSLVTQGFAPHQNVMAWEWNGERENPTLTPSFLLDWGDGNKLHLHVKSGKLDILPDTTIDCTKVERIYRVNVDALQKDLHSEDEE